jgi:enoyl-CoA hydratase
MTAQHTPPPGPPSIDDQGIATVTIHGAKSMNIIGSPEILALTETLKRLRDEPALRVLVLRGRDDRAFIGGADIAEMAALTPATAEVFITRLKDLCEAVRLFPVPVIARLAGWCLGGGLEVAMACDLRLGSTDSQYGMPEVKVGIPSVIHAALMPRLVGPSAASWLLLTGDTIDAATALSLGLVHQVHTTDTLDDAVQRTARQLAGLGPQVLRQQKRLLRDWARLPLEDAIAASVAEFGQAFTTGEPQQHMQRFLERKR